MTLVADVSGREVMVIMNIPSPYRVPLFNELAGQLAEAGYRLRVVFGALGYARRQWTVDTKEFRFDYQVLPSRRFQLGNAEADTLTYPGLYALLKSRPVPITVVIGFSPATLKLWWRSLWRDTPYIIWSGALHNPIYRPVSWLRRWQRRLLVKRASAFIAYGSEARDNLISMGAPADRVHIAINAVDTEFFRDKAAMLALEPRPSDALPRFLYVGYLRPGKNVAAVLHAIAELAKRRRNFVLDVVGDGEQRAELTAMADSLGISDLVVFHGYRQKEELPGFYSRARALLFQTNFDIWGHVLVEGMAAGVPCLASPYAGATRDLIDDGVNGYCVDFADAAAVADRMENLLNDSSLATAMGRAAAETIRQRVSLGISAAGFVAAVKAVDSSASVSHRV